MKIEQLLKNVVDTKSSDLHLVVGVPPVIRIYGKLRPVVEAVVLTKETAKELVLSLMTADQQKRFLKFKELDFSVDLPGLARFRVNTYFQKGTMAAALRHIPTKILTVDELGLPAVCHSFAKLKQGFVLVTGPTGSGKSSTLAAIIDEINQTRTEHIVTIEDPVEFVFENKKSVISQREMGGDTKSWGKALKSVLRQDPDVVLVGEMRDLETIQAALTTAETGHLVLATLHTNSAAQTIDRIVDSFSSEQQAQVRSQLASSLEAVFSQRLIPSIDGKRLVATEVMIVTPAVKTNIREGKIHQIDNIIQTGAEMGMHLLEASLMELVNKGLVDKQVALTYALRPTVLSRLLG
ncbi:type IV pilus twitching motility protein PilT [Patescibacteria group bacterium]|nr:type IV pilus twitching motility protein PilT [Patescibacteria group bacterium]MBU1256832.1 type IV pilus twitching motility protein PilT [Patescibacteria group bacterium]MBU1457463.1 type IV pilus twitching motility protein PilT [Patescibacteria group bacterium]